VCEMPHMAELGESGRGDGPPAPGHGATLMARLHTVASEISGLLTRLGNVRPGPPVTSMDRRRLADQAERSTATLARVCQDLDAWVAQRADDENRVAAAVVDSGQNSRVETEAPGVTLAGVSSAQETLDQARADLHQAVECARARGASWRQIGEALGIAGQTAHKRFDPRARRRHADYMRTRYQRMRGQ
jgi:hypothetical protein